MCKFYLLYQINSSFNNHITMSPNMIKISLRHGNSIQFLLSFISLLLHSKTLL